MEDNSGAAGGTGGSQTQEAVIAIEGMTCDHCSRRVEKALNGCPGVTSAHVTRDPGRAVVRFDPRRTSLGDLHQAVTRSGYTPAPGQP